MQELTGQSTLLKQLGSYPTSQDKSCVKSIFHYHLFYWALSVSMPSFAVIQGDWLRFECR